MASVLVTAVFEMFAVSGVINLRRTLALPHGANHRTAQAIVGTCIGAVGAFGVAWLLLIGD